METKISSQQLVMIFVNEAFEERQSVGQRERERHSKRWGRKGGEATKPFRQIQVYRACED